MYSYDERSAWTGIRATRARLDWLFLGPAPLLDGMARGLRARPCPACRGVEGTLVKSSG